MCGVVFAFVFMFYFTAFCSAVQHHPKWKSHIAIIQTRSKPKNMKSQSEKSSNMVWPHIPSLTHSHNVVCEELKHRATRILNCCLLLRTRQIFVRAAQYNEYGWKTSNEITIHIQQKTTIPNKYNKSIRLNLFVCWRLFVCGFQLQWFVLWVYTVKSAHKTILHPHLDRTSVLLFDSV